jgi:crossover junction endodeoxyribonuclease RuvC
MFVAGIDPGLSGAVAIIGRDGFRQVTDLPVFVVKTGKQTRRVLDLATLRQFLAMVEIDHVMVEQVAARPGQGVTSMFTFGFATGSIIGLLAGLGLPYSQVLPRQWQRHAGCGPSPDAARKRAGELYPAAAPFLGLKKHGGRADAILIARYGVATVGCVPQTVPVAAQEDDPHHLRTLT